MPESPDLKIVPPKDAKATRKPLTTMPGYQLYNMPRSKVTYLVDRIIPAESKFVLSGSRGVWKSWFATSVACSVAAVTPLMGRFHVTPKETVVGGAVLYVSLEERPAEAQRKYQWTLAGMGLDKHPQRIQDMLVEYIVGQPFALDQEGRLDELKRMIEDLKPDLVLWDSLRRMMRGDSNTDEFAERLVRCLDEMQAVWPSTHGVVAHWRKKSGDKELNEPGERVRGSSAILDQMDVHLSIERNKVEDYAILTQDKNRMGEEFGSLNFRMQISEGLAYPSFIGYAESLSAPTEDDNCASFLLKILETDPEKVWTMAQLANLPDVKSRYNDEQVRYGVNVLERRTPGATVERLGRGRSPLVRYRGSMEGRRSGKVGKTDSDLDSKPATPYKDD